MSIIIYTKKIVIKFSFLIHMIVGTRKRFGLFIKLYQKKFKGN
jgi:hypothetical protein